MRRVLGVLACAVALAACAAKAPPEPASPAASPAQSQPGYPGGGYPSPGTAPSTGTPYAPPPPPPAPAAEAPSQPQADLERAQRELDVAAGDCHNACRALGSMDRAAGRVCALASGSADGNDRCAAAKTRVYSARDKVKSSCGQCPDTSVDRNAPVPSR